MNRLIKHRGGKIALLSLLLVIMLSAPSMASNRIAAGYLHSLVIDSDGNVWASGSNSSGQLGNNSVVSSTSPVKVQGLADAIEVAVGWSHSLALLSDGTVWAWGSNPNGELGNNTTTPSLSPQQVPGLAGVIAISAGLYHNLALLSDGTVWAWGDSQMGQTGRGWTVDSLVPEQVFMVSDIVSIAAGGYHNLAVSSSGAVWVWGMNNIVQLGDITYYQINEFEPLPFQLFWLSNVVSVCAGVSHSMALKADGTVLAWGDTRAITGENGSSAYHLSDIPIAGLNNVVAIACGADFCLATKSDGTVWAWGSNSYGQFGNNGALQFSSNPVQVPGLAQVSQTAAGCVSHSAMALLGDGTVKGWGLNNEGNLGDQWLSIHRKGDVVPFKMSDEILSAVVDRGHGILVKKTGVVYVWGSAEEARPWERPWEFSRAGQFGAPNEMAGLTTVVQVATGHEHNLVLKQDGTIWSWGQGYEGQLGNNTQNNSATATLVAGGGQAKMVAAAGYHSMALKNDGTVWVWGLNKAKSGDPICGILGNTADLSKVPIQIAGLPVVVSIATGKKHCVALDVNGEVWAWGGNDQGQLGNNSFTSSIVPVRVANLDHVVEIRSGDDHVLALKEDGSVWAWGSNSAGQLGNNSLSASNHAVEVSGIEAMVSIGAGSLHSLAIDGKGRVRGWGSNDFGQLGGLQASISKVPVVIEDIEGVLTVDGGVSSSVAVRQDGSMVTWGSGVGGQLGGGIEYSNVCWTPTWTFQNVNSLHHVEDLILEHAGTTVRGALGDEVAIKAEFPIGVTPGRVDFYAFGQLVGSDSTYPFEILLPIATWGKFQITAIGVDATNHLLARAQRATVAVAYDEDNDGLPDWWELKYFGNIFSKPSADPDGDRVSNIDEYALGTDPLLGLAPASMVGTPPMLTWVGSLSGSNSGAGGGLLAVPPALGDGQPESASFEDLVYPASPGPGVPKEEMDAEQKFAAMNYYRDFWDFDSRADIDNKSWYWHDSDGDSGVSASSQPPFEMGIFWAEELGAGSGSSIRLYEETEIPGPDNTHIGIVSGEEWNTFHSIARACMAGRVESTRWWYRYGTIQKTRFSNWALVSNEILGRVRFVIKPGEVHSSQTVELTPTVAWELGHNEAEYWEIVYSNNGDSLPGHTVSASDATGPGYRKIGLNGTPMADSKPQVKDETGEISEETYIDAFTRQLNYSVSDVYADVASSLLPLAVRRNAKEQTWSLRRGLRGSEGPDSPFGPGWASNLCASIRFEDWYYRKAVVTDEQGVTTIFVRPTENPVGVPVDQHVWIHSREEKHGVKTAFDTLETIKDLEGEVTGFVYRKKFGTVCEYEMTDVLQNMTTDRVDGSNDHLMYRYARLTKVKDRLNNELIYTYPDATTLIPKKIHDPERPNQVVTITQNDGVVTAVRGPSGETIQYNYVTQNNGDDQVRCLTSVERGGALVSYQYETQIETTPAGDVDPNGPLDPDYRHFNLTRIIDERGGEYDFEYEFNHGCKYVEVSGEGYKVRSQLGMPRLIKKVTLPNNAIVNLGGVRDIRTQADATLGDADVVTTVNGPAGQYTYTFSEPDLFVPLLNDPGKEHDRFSKQLTVFFSRMTLNTPAGNEVYNFDFDHGMALTSATDLSGNTTTFHYGTVGANGLGWDDPIRQVNALGKSRYFTYDDDTRVMKSMTDERGTLTSYTVQAGTGLRTKETISKGGSTLRVTDFDYGVGGFAGFLARTTVQSTTATGGDLVTEYTPDANGRVQKEAVTAGGGIELVTSYTYTGNGSKKTVTNPRGHTTTFTYDAQSLRLTGVENPDSTTRTLGYDAHGNLTSEVNERGVTTTHEYDSLNRRKKSTVDMDDGADLVSETTYTALNLPHTETDPRGTVTTHTYDGIGRRLTTMVGSGGDAQTTTFTYGTNSGGSVFDVSGFKPTTITDPRGKVTTITYDALYRPTVKQLPEGNTVTTTYDDAGNPEEVKDALNRITKTTFDGLNRPTKVEYPDATTRHSYYTPSGLVWKVVDELGRETFTQYDRAGRAVEVTLPAVNGVSPVTKTAYDANGNVIAVQDPLGNITTTVYDNRNRPTKVTSPYIWDALAGQWSRPEVNTTYDAGGNVLTVTDPLGKVTTKTHNNAGWGLTVTNALGQVTSSTYDRNGNVKTVTDALSRVVTNTYDVHNRLIETEDAEEQITTFGYDKNGNRTSVTDPRGKVTTFTYDDLNRLKKETFQEGVWTERHYDAVRETSREDSAGREFTFGYDLRDRLTTTTWTVGGSPVVRTRVYDTAGRLTDVTETGRPEATVGYTYDALDRVATETSQGLTHTYTYDLGGRRTGTALGTGKSIATTYDSQGKPLTVTEGGRTTVYHYDLASRAVAQTQPNGQWQYNAYDDLGRLESRQTYTSTDALQAQFLWTYDAVGNVTVQSERWPGEGTRGAGWRSTVMVYDATNRLTGEAMAQPGSPVVTTGYAYDAGSNRSVKLVSTDGSLTTQTLYTYNDFNQLTGWSEEDGQATVTRTAALTYDLAGNRDAQTLTVTGQSAETTTYHWDAENRLEGVTLPNADEHEYGYDYRTRRISRVENGVGTAIVFSGGLSVAEYESQGLTPTVEYLRGPDMGGGVGGMMYSLRNGGTEAKYATSNGRGDVVAQSNDAGALTWTASYEAYGKRPVETGTNLDRQRANTKEEDPTGLLNEGFRYRDIETGVWLSRDPAGFVDGPNLYAYVRQNPWTMFDPEGLHWQSFSSLPQTQSLGTSFQRAEMEGQRDGAAGAIGGATKVVGSLVIHAAIMIPRLGSGSVYAEHCSGEFAKMVDRGMAENFGANTSSLNYEVGDFGGRMTAMIALALASSKNSRSGPENTSKVEAKRTDSFVKRQLTAQEEHTYRRVQPRATTKREVWERAKGEDGKVYDPETGIELKYDEPWVMGHKPDHEFNKAKVSAAERGITREQWIEEQNNPNIYRPESNATSSKHKHETPSNSYGGDNPYSTTHDPNR